MSDLLVLIETEKKNLEKALKISTAVSVLLVILVSAEVLFIRHVFHQKLTPKNVAMMAMDAVYGNLPEINNQLLLGAEQNAPILADQFVAYSIDTIRNLQPLVYDNLIVLTDQLMAEVKAQGVPAFQKMLLELYANIAENKEKLSDQQFAEQAVRNLLDEWQLEFQKQLDAGFNIAVDYLGNETSILLAVPENELTKKQAAEKQLLACSQILIDRLAADQEPISSMELK